MLKHYLPLAIVPVALILWGFLGAAQLTTASYFALVDYHSPYFGGETPGAPSDPLTPQVVIIVADGLRLDESQKMDNLNMLRARGADRVMRVGLPSLSLPGWSVIGTGAWQEQHGQTTNFDARPLGLDSIFLAARRRGLTTALTGSPGWEVLYKGHIDIVRIEPDPKDSHHHPDDVRRQDDAIEADALSILKDSNPNLLLIHFTAPDNAYHGFGVFSAEGQRARQDVDARLGRLLQAISLDRTTVLFTADHGHIDRGGHGGPEETVLNVEFVAGGKAIRPGKYEPAMQTDIAPTTALLLGTSLPSDSQGDILIDMLEMSPPAKAERAVEWAQQIVTRYTAIAQVIGIGAIDHPKLAQSQAALAAGDDPLAITAAQSEVSATRDGVFAFREGRLQQERLSRTPMLLLFLLPLAVYAWLMRRMNWEFHRPLIGALIYFLIFFALFFGRGYSFSLSMLNEDTQIVTWFAQRTVDALIALTGSALVLGVLSRGEFRVWTVLNTFNMAFLIAAGLWLQICVFYWLYDFTWAWYLPDQVLGFKYYIDVLQTGAFMVKSPPVPTILLMPLLALGAKWLTERSGALVSRFRT
jgi:hypothetical protein